METFKVNKYIGGYQQFGEVLRAIRVERKLKLYKVAERIGMSKKTVHALEESDGNTGSILGLLLLLNYYRVTPSDFWARVVEETNKVFAEEGT